MIELVVGIMGVILNSNSLAFFYVTRGILNATHLTLARFMINLFVYLSSLSKSLSLILLNDLWALKKNSFISWLPKSKTLWLRSLRDFKYYTRLLYTIIWNFLILWLLFRMIYRISLAHIRQCMGLDGIPLTLQYSYVSSFSFIW